jgi:hypothetical protein
MIANTAACYSCRSRHIHKTLLLGALDAATSQAKPNQTDNVSQPPRPTHNKPPNSHTAQHKLIENTGANEDIDRPDVRSMRMLRGPRRDCVGDSMSHSSLPTLSSHRARRRQISQRRRRRLADAIHPNARTRITRRTSGDDVLIGTPSIDDDDDDVDVVGDDTNVDDDVEFAATIKVEFSALLFAAATYININITVTQQSSSSSNNRV